MGSFYLILGLIFSLLIAIVALANNETVTVSYIFGRAEVSLILLILGSAVVGALAMGLFSLFRSIRSALAFRQLRHQQEELQKNIKNLEEEKIFLIAELNKHVSVAEENLEAENTENAEEKIEQQDEEAVGDDEVKEESS
ncbi:MAG: LapA family protein [Bacillota bacterium]|nr:LapA family protein [Bacillota bacterium]